MQNAPAKNQWFKSLTNNGWDYPYINNNIQLNVITELMDLINMFLVFACGEGYLFQLVWLLYSLVFEVGPESAVGTHPT